MAMSKNEATARAVARARHNERYYDDPQYRARRLCAAALRSALKCQGVKKDYSIAKLIGCTLAGLRSHVEALFEPGMTWTNIHLDHIRPCASFDLTDPRHQRACFNFNNLRPLWPTENQKKGARSWPGNEPATRQPYQRSTS